MIRYRKLADRTPDNQYRKLLRTIKTKGKPFISPHPVGSRWWNTFALRYDLRNGVPFLTERNVSRFWQSSIAELFAFFNGIHTQEELIKFGVNPIFWGDTVTKEKCAVFGLEEGDLGPGSYGPGFVNHPGLNGRVNQIEVVFGRMNDPKKRYMRTHEVTAWIADAVAPKRQVVTAPCHGVPISWHIYKDPEGGKRDILDMTVRQRSGDTPVGIVSNLIQYSALHIASAHVLDLEAREYVHDICNAHIYDNQMPAVNKLLRRKPFPFPRLVLTKDAPKNIFDFRPHHFKLLDYRSHLGMKIPVVA